jgi:hypothetical protein
MNGQNQHHHPLDAETSESLLSGLNSQGSIPADSRRVEENKHVVPINRNLRKEKAVKTEPVQQPIQYETPQEYYSEQQVDNQYPTTYIHPEEQTEWEEERRPRGSVTISRWRLQLLETVATVSGSTLIFSIISLSPLRSIFLSLSPQVVLGVMGTAILGVGFLGEIPLPDNLNRTARKTTTVLLGVVLGYVFWWAIVSRTPVLPAAPSAPFITQPRQ